MSKQTLNIEDLEYQPWSHGDRFKAQLGAVSTKELKYLAVSTMMWPEIAEYPDSDKTGVLANFPAQGDGKPEAMRFIIRTQADMADYWDGE